jgi:hypothetical protein
MLHDEGSFNGSLTHCNQGLCGVCRALESVMQRTSAEQLQSSRSGMSWPQQVLVAFFDWYLKLPPVASKLQQAYDMWQDDSAAPIASMLFLFSESDSIVDAAEVRAFAKKQVCHFGIMCVAAQSKAANTVCNCSVAAQHAP